MEKLPLEVRSLIRSSINIRNYTDAVSELVYNCLDANATSVAVRVDFTQNNIQVVDNGQGIRKDDLKCTGKKHMTNKCSSTDELQNNLKTFGFRGEVLSSVVNISERVTIESLYFKEDKTYSKVFFKGVEDDTVTETKMRASHGTTITIQNFMYNLGVRQRSVDPVCEMEEIRSSLCKIALLHYSVSFTLRDDADGKLVLKTHKSSSVREASGYLFDESIGRTLVAVSVKSGQCGISGYVAREMHSKKSLQFVYVNRRFVKDCELTNYCNVLLCAKFSSQCAMRENVSNKEGPSFRRNFKSVKYPVFIMDITCPQDEYDVTFMPDKSIIQFKRVEKLKRVVKKFVQEFVGKVSMDGGNFSSDLKNDDGAGKSGCNMKDAKKREIERVVGDILSRNAEEFGASQMHNAIKGNPAKRHKKLHVTKDNRDLFKNNVVWTGQDENNKCVTPQQYMNKIVQVDLKRRKHKAIRQKSKEVNTRIVEMTGKPAMRETPFILSQIELNAKTLIKSRHVFNLKNHRKNVGVNVNILSKKFRRIRKKFNEKRRIFRNERMSIRKTRNALGEQCIQTNVVRVNYDSHKNFHMANQCERLISVDQKTIQHNHTMDQNLNELFTTNDLMTIFNILKNKYFCEGDSINQNNLNCAKQTIVTPHKRVTDLIKTVIPEKEVNLNDKRVTLSRFNQSGIFNKTADETTSEIFRNIDIPKLKYRLCDITMDKTTNSKIGKIINRDLRPERRMSDISEEIFKSKCDNFDDNVRQTNRKEQTFPNSKEIFDLTLDENIFRHGDRNLENDLNSNYDTTVEEILRSGKHRNDFSNYNNGIVVSEKDEAILETNQNKEHVLNSKGKLPDISQKQFLNKSSIFSKCLKNSSAQTILNLNDIADMIQKCEYLKETKNKYNSAPNLRFFNSQDSSFSGSIPNRKDAENLVILETSLSSDCQKILDVTSLPCNDDFSVHFESSESIMDNVHLRNLNANDFLEIIQNDNGIEYNNEETSIHRKACEDIAENDKRNDEIHNELNEIDNTEQSGFNLKDVDSSKITDYEKNSNQSVDAVSKNLSLFMSVSFNFEETEKDNIEENAVDNFHENISKCSEEKRLEMISDTNFHESKTTISKDVSEVKKVTSNIVSENKTSKDVTEVKNVSEDKLFTSNNVLKDVTSNDASVDKLLNSKSVLQQRVLTSKNVSENNVLTSKNILQEKELTFKDASVDKPMNSKSVLQQRVLTSKNVPGNNELTSKNILQEKELAFKDASVDKPTNSKSVLQQRVLTSKNILQEKELAFKDALKVKMSTSKTISEDKMGHHHAPHDKSSFKDASGDKSSPNVENNEWDIKTDSLGKVFYVNRRTGMTLYENPEDNSSTAFRMFKRPNFVPKGLSPILKLGEVNWTFGNQMNSDETLAKSKADEENLSRKMKHGDFYYADEAYEKFVSGLQIDLGASEMNVGNGRAMLNLNRKKFKPGSSFSFTKEMLKDVKVINQVDKKFICATVADGERGLKYVVLFDQHAVHERIQLEKLIREYRTDKRWKSSNVSNPIRLSVQSSDLPLLVKYRNEFESLGVSFVARNSTNNCSIDITTLPSCFGYSELNKDESLSNLVNEMINEELDVMRKTKGHSSTIPATIMKVISSKACHSAIKFGVTLTKEQCVELLKDLADCDVPFQCAHGRPSLTILIADKVPQQSNAPTIKKLNFGNIKKYLNNK